MGPWSSSLVGDGTCRWAWTCKSPLTRTLRPETVVHNPGLVPSLLTASSIANSKLYSDIFNLAVLILAILTVGNFLRDQKSNYLEGFLCVIVYIIIAVAAFYNPTLSETGETSSESSTTAERSLRGL